MTRKLKNLGLEAALPDKEKHEVWWRKITTGGLTSTFGVSLSTSVVSLTGKTLVIGGEERVVASYAPALLVCVCVRVCVCACVRVFDACMYEHTSTHAPTQIRTNKEEGQPGATYTEMTDDFVAKVKKMRDEGDRYKGPPLEVPASPLAQ